MLAQFLRRPTADAASLFFRQRYTMQQKRRKRYATNASIIGPIPYHSADMVYGRMCR
jgi:hypothetical protein